jgi:hypothetical protein
LSDFVPDGYTPLPIAAVYAVARYLEYVTNSSDGEVRKEITRQVINSDFQLSTVSLRVTDIEYLTNEYDDTELVGVALHLEPSVAEGDFEATVWNLEPPYFECLDEHSEPKESGSNQVYHSLPIDPFYVGYTLQQHLASGQLPAFLIEESGAITGIPPEFWRTEMGKYVLNHGGPAAVLKTDGRSAMGRVLVPDDELEKFCNPEPEVEELQIPASLPPYLTFMLRAVSELKLTPDDRRLKKEIGHWIEQNWPPEFGPLTPNKREYMTTFLRHPKYEIGGNPKSVKRTSGGADNSSAS